MATNFSVKLAKSAYSPLVVAMAFGKGLQYRTSDFKMVSAMIWLYRVKHLMNFGSVAPEFTRVKGVRP